MALDFIFVKMRLESDVDRDGRKWNPYLYDRKILLH